MHTTMKLIEVKKTIQKYVVVFCKFHNFIEKQLCVFF